MYSLAFLPLLVASALAGHLAVEPIPQYTQEQNTATGEYGYSYSGGPSSKTEFRALDGTTTGAYSYVDAHGILQTVNYIADEFGFRAAGSNIPSEGSVPLDAPDVAVAKAAHLAEHSRQTLEALRFQRKKRSLVAAAPVAVATTYSHVPLATSSQSRVQIHSGAKIVQHISTPVVAAAPVLAAAPAPLLATSHAYLLRKKRGIAAAAYAAPAAIAAPLPPSSAKIYDEFASRPAAAAVHAYAAPAVHAYAAPAAIAAPAAVEVRTTSVAAAPIATTYSQLPLATSSQSRVQIHNGAKIIEQVSAPVVAAAAPVAYAAPAALVAAPAAIATTYSQLPLATSSQSRVQIHNGAKIVQEFSQPIFAPVAAAAAAAPLPVAAAAAFPAPAPAYLPASSNLGLLGAAPAAAAPAAVAPVAEAAISDDAIAVDSA